MVCVSGQSMLSQFNLIGFHGKSDTNVLCPGDHVTVRSPALVYSEIFVACRLPFLLSPHHTLASANNATKNVMKFTLAGSGRA